MSLSELIMNNNVKFIVFNYLRHDNEFLQET